MQETTTNENIEITLLLEAIFIKYGYDFRNYSRASIKRRLLKRRSLSKFQNYSEMQHRLLNDQKFFELLLDDLSINVTEMFRDPSFYKEIREKVIPELKKLDYIKVWHAGCATGEEVYSMAILLKEEGLYEKCRIYATDFSEKVIMKAKAGIYPAELIQKHTQNYQKSGGRASFADYYTAKYDNAILDKSLIKNVVFSDHNLVTDGSFSEMDVIICRNVLIYFSRKLQNRVFKLFSDSLVPGGFLCLGTKESIRFSNSSDEFEDFKINEKIYRKKIPGRRHRGVSRGAECP